MTGDSLRAEHLDEATSGSNHEELWAQLCKATLLGTERSQLSVSQLASIGQASKQTSKQTPKQAQGQAQPHGQLAAALTSISTHTGSAERGLLLAAATVDHYQRVGATTSALSIEQIRVSASGEAHENNCSPGAAQLLDILLSSTVAVAGQQHDLIALWAQRCAANNLTPEPRQLCALLSHATKHRSTHPSLKQTVGRAVGPRGVLLANLRSEWKWVLEASRKLDEPTAVGSISSAVFEVTEISVRDELLRQWRERDPAAALAAILPGWATNKSDERTNFIYALTIGLSDADEPFLERCLDDKSKGVRSASAKLLSSVLSSAFAQRMSDRVAALVRVERTGLLRRQSIEVDLPDEAAIDERWKRDGFDLSLASAGTGRRAWALRKLVESAPLYAWEIATGLTPERTVEALQSSPVVSELTDGWCAATLREGDPSWANALCSTPGNGAWRAAAALCAEDANRHVKMVLGAPKPVEAGLHGLLGAVAGKLHSDTIDALIDWFGTDSNQWVGVDAIGLWFTNANSTQMGLLLRRFEPDDPRHKQIRHLEAARSLRDAILKEFP